MEPPLNESKDSPLSSSPNWSILSSSPKWGSTRPKDSEEDSPSFSSSRHTPASATIATATNSSEWLRSWVPNFFHSFQHLSISSISSRSEALDRLGKFLKGCKIEDARQYLQPHLPAMIMLATECPFAEIRAEFGQFLGFVERELGIKVPFSHQRVSYFIANEVLVPVEPVDDYTRRLFCNIFIQTGKGTWCHKAER